MNFFRLYFSHQESKSHFMTVYVIAETMNEAVKKAETKFKIEKLFSAEKLNLQQHFIIP